MNDQEERAKRVTDFLGSIMTQRQLYHNHKETMAHLATVVTLGLVVAVLGTKPWPPEWVPAFCISREFVAGFGVMVLWLWIHCYIRWQLRNRREAAIYVEALLKILRAWATSLPTHDQLKPWDQPPPRVAKIHVGFDFLIPWKWSNVTAKEEIRGYPTGLVEELLQPSVAFTGEAIVTYGSLFLGVILIVRML